MAGTRIPLTLEGVLAATAGAQPGPGTVIEIPWRLHVRPDTAAWRHPVSPVTSTER